MIWYIKSKSFSKLKFFDSKFKLIEMLKKVLAMSLIFLLLPTLASAQGLRELTEALSKKGFFDILLFALFLIIFFALLQKSKILGESSVINGIVAVIAAFLISYFPSITGFSLTEPMSRFFTQASAILLLFLVALLAASFFYPNLPKMLAEHIKGPTLLYVLIPLALALLVTSRMIWVMWAGYRPGGEAPGVDVTIVIVGLIIFVVVLLVAAAIAGGGGKK